MVMWAGSFTFFVSMEICPVCAAYPGGNPNHQTRDFSGHLMLDHSLRDADLISFKGREREGGEGGKEEESERERTLKVDKMVCFYFINLDVIDYDQGGMHNRVRRMMVRRRGGGERHYPFFRESQISQDSSVDPLSELLSHLGKRNEEGEKRRPSRKEKESEIVVSLGGAGRRLPSDIPPHIQQLLDHQDRQQTFERASPLRRPVYRKLLVGGHPRNSSKPWGGGAQVWKKTSCRFKTEEKIYDSRRLYLYLLLISLSIRILFACIKSVWCVCALIRVIYVAVICALIRKEWCAYMWYM